MKSYTIISVTPIVKVREINPLGEKLPIRRGDTLSKLAGKIYKHFDKDLKEYELTQDSMIKLVTKECCKVAPEDESTFDVGKVLIGQVIEGEIVVEGNKDKVKVI